MEKFIGKFSGEFIPGTREFRLDSYLVYVTKDGDEVSIPRGSVVDGASIPRAFWPVIGSPYSGPYRKSSAIHDVLCQEKHIPSEIVHELFTDMVMFEGNGSIRSRLMGWAVRNFGPKW